MKSLHAIDDELIDVLIASGVVGCGLMIYALLLAAFGV
jgi:hypothetical protein